MSGPATLFLARDLHLHGGVTRVLETLLRARPGTAGPWRVATLEPPEPRADALFTGLGAPPIAVGDDGYLGPASRLRTALRREPVRVIVANTFKSLLVARLAAAGMNVRVAYWIHSGTDVLQGPVRPRVAALLTRSDARICVSAYVRDLHALTRRNGAHVVHNGVAPDAGPREDRGALRAELGFAPDDEVAGYVASFVPFKDHGTLIRAFARAHALRPALRLALFGTGPLEGDVREAVREAGLDDAVRFLGVRPDVRRVLPALDLYVHPADGEGFGLAVVEAMLASLPVLAARAGALPELVDDGRTGALVPAQDPDAWADAIVDAMSRPDARLACGHAARDHAVAAYAPDRFAARIAAILEGLAA